MNAQRMDQKAVERLLDGPVTGPQGVPEALVRLLTAVRAAPRPHELTGEAAAVRAFRMARAGSLPLAASRPERRIIAGLLSAKITLAALLAAGTGGVALAAATGALPGPLGGGDEGPTAPTASAGERPSPTGRPEAAPATPGRTTGGPTDSPSLFGLCTAYRAEAGDQRRRVLESPRFAELVTAAGEREKVPDYCDRLLDGGGEQDDPASTRTVHPGNEPTGRVTGRPDPATPGITGAPIERPTTPPVNLPASTGPSPD